MDECCIRENALKEKILKEMLEVSADPVTPILFLLLIPISIQTIMIMPMYVDVLNKGGR